MITLPGEKMASRVGASLLRAVGLDKQLVVSTLSEYEELAVALAEDSERLYSMRQHLESTRTTNALFQTSRWIRNYELGLLKVWKRYEQSLPPEHVEVEDTDPIFTVPDASVF